MIHKIANILKMQYFSVDYVRSSDSLPVFTDVNVYPLPIAYTEVVRQLGYYGRWLRFDDNLRSGGKKSSKDLFWNKFDQAMRNLVGSKAHLNS
jgi:hypothetical protein